MNVYFFTEGLLPGNPDLKIDDLTDVRQLEGLFRSHVMLAQLAGQGAVPFSHYCFMAYRFIMAIWHVSMVRIMMCMVPFLYCTSFCKIELHYYVYFYTRYGIMEKYLVIKLWYIMQVSLRQTGPVIKEIAKQPPPEPTKGSAKGKSKKEKEVWFSWLWIIWGLPNWRLRNNKLSTLGKILKN